MYPKKRIDSTESEHYFQPRKNSKNNNRFSLTRMFLFYKKKVVNLNHTVTLRVLNADKFALEEEKKNRNMLKE